MPAAGAAATVRIGTVRSVSDTEAAFTAVTSVAIAASAAIANIVVWAGVVNARSQDANLCATLRSVRNARKTPRTTDA